MIEYKEVFHTTQLGIKSIIQSQGWIVSRNSPHDAFYGRGIYFWERESDAHCLGRLWYKDNYEIVSEIIPFCNNFSIIDRDMEFPKDADLFSQYFLNKGINILIIPKAYYNHRTKIEALGCSYVWLVCLSSNNDSIKIKF